VLNTDHLLRNEQQAELAMMQPMESEPQQTVQIFNPQPCGSCHVAHMSTFCNLLLSLNISWLTMACREPQGSMKSMREKKAQQPERHRGKDENCSIRKHVRKCLSLGPERLCTHDWGLCANYPAKTVIREVKVPNSRETLLFCSFRALFFPEL
jgi:hypothetical protein